MGLVGIRTANGMANTTVAFVFALACASDAGSSWTKDGADADALARDRQECLQESLTGVPGPSAGDQAFGEYDPETFRQCMRRRGWRPDTGGDAPAR